MRLSRELVRDVGMPTPGTWTPLQWGWFRVGIAVLALFDLAAPALALDRGTVSRPIVHISIPVPHVWISAPQHATLSPANRQPSIALPATRYPAASGYPTSSGVVSQNIADAPLAADRGIGQARNVSYAASDGLPFEAQPERLSMTTPLDELLNTPAVHPDGTPDRAPVILTPPHQTQSIHIPVLMYHQIAPNADRYVTPLAKFDKELDWLVANGYQSVTIDQVYAYMYDGGALPPKPVVITLDDGTAGHMDAATALEAHHMKGVFLIPSGVSELSPEQIRSLSDRGHEIVSHSVTHPFLTQVSDEQLANELRQSKKDLEAIIGKPVDYFGYPFGDWDDRVAAAVQAAGYKGALHAWGGQDWTSDKRFIEPRVEISGLLSIDEFAYTVQYGE